MNFKLEALSHFGAGLVLSAVDYASHRKNTQERTKEKVAVLQSLDTILEAEKEGVVTVDPQSYAYAMHVSTVRDYLEQEKLLPRESQSRMQRFRQYMKDEKINGFSLKQRFIFAAATEIGYDSMWGAAHYSMHLKLSPIGAMALNIYQIPCFVGGLTVGSAVTSKLKKWSRSAEEKELDATTKDLVHENSKIIDLVANYQMPEPVKEELSQQGVQVYGDKISSVGRATLQKALGTANHVVHALPDYLAHRRAEQAVQRDTEKARIESRFDDLTRGH